MSSISVRVLQGIIAGAVARGVDVGALLAAASLTPAQLADPDQRLPPTCADRLWHHAARLSGDDLLGIHVAELFAPADLGGLGFAVRSSATVGESYRRIVRYLKLLVAVGALSLHEEGRQVRIRRSMYSDELSPSRHAHECLFMTLLLIGRRSTEDPFLPQQVRFSHPEPSAAAGLAAALGGPVEFDQPVTELVLDARLMNLPLRESEPALAAVLDRHLEEQARGLPSGASLLERVRAVLASELRSGEPTLADTAKRLSMSSRSLQRSLQGQGTTLQEVLQSLRADLAQRYLAEQRESIAEVAFLLGFSEVSTFHRAFKRWTGQTPHEYRAASLHALACTR